MCIYIFVLTKRNRDQRSVTIVKISKRASCDMFLSSEVALIPLLRNFGAEQKNNFVIYIYKISLFEFIVYTQ